MISAMGVNKTMEDRPLGLTGVSVSSIGFGAWGIGGTLWIGADDEESTRALHRALDLGVTLIDTALGYGMGHSETLIGRVRRERKETVLVATKVPPRNRLWPAAADIPVTKTFPADHVTRSAEQSLWNLGVERIDLLQLHVWHDRYLQQDDGWRRALEKLRAEGKVRFVGISVNDHDPGSALLAAASGIFDTVQVIYNVFDPSPARELFPVCLEHGVGVLARVPFDEGALTGAIGEETTFPAGDFRNQYFGGDRRREVAERVAALRELLGAEAEALSELALRFCLSHDAVSSVIPGMRKVKNVEANVRAGDGRRLSPALLERLAAHAWERNFYA